MRSRAELANMRVAKLASLKKGWCLPKKKALASAKGGIFGFAVHK